MLAIGLVLVDLPFEKTACIEPDRYLSSTYLLVFAVMASDGAVRSFGFNRLAIGADEDGGHETKATVSYLTIGSALAPSVDRSHTVPWATMSDCTSPS